MKPTLFVLLAASSALFGQIDPTIPLRGRPPQFNDPLEMARRAAEIRNQQIQNQIQEEELRRIRRENDSPVSAAAAAAASPAKGQIGNTVTDGLLNGRM